MINSSSYNYKFDVHKRLITRTENNLKSH